MKGVFFLLNGWSGDGWTSFSGGYPWRVDYTVWSGQIYPDGSLSWGFWMWNAGWVSFSHWVGWTTTTQINCPTSIWNDATQPCPVSGAAWSQNAGWIVFWGSDIGTGSGAYFDPNTGNLAGWWWNRWLGWIPLWSGLSGSVVPDASTPTDPINGVPINFVSKIAIVWNIAGSRIFSVENNATVNQDVWYSYTTVNHANILNLIKKSISIISRNISDADLASLTSPHNFLIYKSIPTYNMDFWWITPLTKRSIIVIGWDILIDKAIINAENWTNKPIWLIALKDNNGSGWNVIITDKVKQIYAFIYAEWTVYSGEKPAATIVPYTDSWIWFIPKWQLYIRWLVASKNTIWGSQQKPTPICPVLVASCTTAQSYAYDWDYFRTYDTTDPTQSSLPPERIWVPKLQNATMIIEYDSTILTDPPPGFQEQ